MRISQIETRHREGAIERSAIVASDVGGFPTQDLWFRVSEEHATLIDTDSANPFVVGSCLAAMAAGEKIHSSDPVCPTLAGPLPWHVLDAAVEPPHRWFIWEDLLPGFKDDA